MKPDTLIENATFHAFVSTLFTSVHGLSPRKFQEKVFDRLQTLVAFDKALWLSGYLGELLVTQCYLYNLPESLMVSWESRKGQDKVLQGLLDESPGKTVDMREFYTREERAAADIYRQHSAKFGIEHVITTALPDYHTGLLEVISLYRSDPKKPFSREDRKMKEFLFPLMVDAFCYNQLNYMLSQSRQGRSAAMAVCDEKAWLRHCEPGFYPILKTVWPDWKGPVLPQPFLALISSPKAAMLRYDEVNFRHEKIGKLRLIFAHRRNLTLKLTRREDEIAVMFASGKNYRNIAGGLNISPGTVRNHIESVYRKLNVSNKVQLIEVLNRE